MCAARAEVEFFDKLPLVLLLVGRVEHNHVEERLCVFDALRARVGNLFDGQVRRRVDGESHPLLLRLVGEREEGRARNVAVRLDEIHAHALERVHGLARLALVRHGQAVLQVGLRAVNERPGPNDARAD